MPSPEKKELQEAIFQKQSNLILKHYPPLISKLIDDSKPDFKFLLYKIINMSYKQLGNDLFTGMNSKKISQINEILQAQ